VIFIDGKWVSFHRGVRAAVFCLIIAGGCRTTVPAWGAGPVVDANLTVGERYDDNSRFVQGEKTTSFITSIMPKLAFSDDRQWIRYGLTYTGDLQYYSPDTDLSTMSHHLNAFLGKDLTPSLTITLSDALSRSPDSLQAGQNLNLLLPRTGILSNVSSITASYRATKKTTLSSNFSHGFTTYDSSSLRDFSTDAVSGTLSQQLSPWLTGNISYAHNWTFPSNAPRYETDTFTAGFSWDALPKTRVSGSVGWFVPSADISSSTITASGLITRAFKNGAGSVGYSRGASNTGGLVSGLTVSETVTASYSHQFQQWLSGRASGSYLTNNSILTDTIKTEAHSSTVSLTAILTESISGQVLYTYFRQLSRGSIGQTVSRNQAAISLTYKFWSYGSPTNPQAAQAH
jgi:hypothetical protein